MEVSPPYRPVLYAEDDENDAFLMQRAFAKAGVSQPLRIVPDGRQVIQYLSGVGAYADRQTNPLPSLLILDLNMPGFSGLELLQWVREKPALKELTVVILTSSNQNRDIDAAKKSGANAYLVKPANPDKLIEMVASLRDCCLTGEAPPKWLPVLGNQRLSSGSN